MHKDVLPIKNKTHNSFYQELNEEWNKSCNRLFYINIIKKMGGKYERNRSFISHVTNIKSYDDRWGNYPFLGEISWQNRSIFTEVKLFLWYSWLGIIFHSSDACSLKV